ncbi:MAG: HEAT repeat domain-containing protein, partial [Thermoplasmata archaeon]
AGGEAKAVVEAGAVQPLVHALADELVRGRAALALGSIAAGGEAKAVVEAGAVQPLVHALADNLVRGEAAEALGSIARHGEAKAVVEAGAVQPLVHALADKWVRRWAAWALGAIAYGGEAKAVVAAGAVPRLVKALSDANEQVRGDAALALGEIGEAGYGEEIANAGGLEKLRTLVTDNAECMVWNPTTKAEETCTVGEVAREALKAKALEAIEKRRKRKSELGRAIEGRKQEIEGLKRDVAVVLPQELGALLASAEKALESDDIDGAEKAIAELDARISTLKATAKPELVLELPDITTKAFAPGEWRILTCRVTNKGNAVARDVEIRIGGDFTARESMVIPRVEYSQITERKLRIKTDEAGELLLTVSAKCKGLDGKEIEFEPVEYPVFVGQAEPVRKEMVEAANVSQPKPPGEEWDVMESYVRMLTGKYEFLEKMHEGKWSIVWKARRKRDGQIVCVKFPNPKNELAGKVFLREVDSHRKLKHPGIVTVFDYNSIPCSYIELELVEGKNFAVFVEENKLSQREIANIVYSVVEACVYAYHHKGIVNCDLKPEHVVVAPNGNAKVIDWGGIYRTASAGSSEASGIVLHTLPWAAPEVREKIQRIPDDKTMVYELAAILYWALTKQKPGVNGMEGIVKATALQPEIKELLSAGLKEKMEERLSLIEFGERLNKIYGLGKEKGRLELWLSRDKRQRQLYYVYIRWYEEMAKRGMRDPGEYLAFLEELREAFPEQIEKMRVEYEKVLKALNYVKSEGLCTDGEEESKIKEFVEKLGRVV